jgi:hypothetical protein
MVNLCINSSHTPCLIIGLDGRPVLVNYWNRKVIEIEVKHLIHADSKEYCSPVSVTGTCASKMDMENPQLQVPRWGNAGIPV